MIFTYQHNDHTYTVRLERGADGAYAATIDGRSVPFVAEALADGGWLLTVDGQQIRVYAAAQGRARYISTDGETYTVTVPESGTARRRSGGSGGDLTAQMPGQVVEVLVAEGETVEAGQALVVLEAMKMEIRVASPAAGRVKHILVSKGAVVERGQRLVEVEVAE